MFESQNFACLSHQQVCIDHACWGDIEALEKLKEKLVSQEEKLSNLAQSEDQLVKQFEDMNVQVRLDKLLPDCLCSEMKDFQKS